MTKDELKRKYIKWAERCGIAEKLGDDLDESVEKILQNVPPRILEMADEAVIEKTTIAAVLSTRFVDDWGDKNLDAQVALFAICCSEILYQMQSEIDALKEKTRWRKQSEEPAPDSVAMEIFDVTRMCVASPRERGFYIPAFCYWRPLDLPEEEKAE